MIADEVGLGKTIETALILRELASRGELDRALMVVPAGLVHNWHRELNEVFNLDFEIFGSEGDITDRKTNAFAKHDRLIASIDTLVSGVCGPLNFRLHSAVLAVGPRPMSSSGSPG